jgi:site-specific DNA-methyltransferase (adenine-specific)
MTTPYYQDDSCTLHLGDYREVIDGLKASEVACDAVITDPPYGETNLKWDRWVDGWLGDAAVISDALWCFGSFRMFHDHADEFKAWRFSQDLVWEKHNGSSLANDRFRRVHEIAALWYRGDWGNLRHETPTTPDVTPRALRRRATKGEHQGARGASAYVSEDGGPRLMRSVLQVRSEHGRAIHPTQKPLGIVAPLIEYSVPPGGLVVDFFAGSATVGLAARMLGRRAVLFEAHEPYAEAAAERLAQQEFDLGGAA